MNIITVKTVRSLRAARYVGKLFMDSDVIKYSIAHPEYIYRSGRYIIWNGALIACHPYWGNPGGDVVAVYSNDLKTLWYNASCGPTGWGASNFPFQEWFISPIKGATKISLPFPPIHQALQHAGVDDEPNVRHSFHTNRGSIVGSARLAVLYAIRNNKLSIADKYDNSDKLNMHLVRWVNKHGDIKYYQLLQDSLIKFDKPSVGEFHRTSIYGRIGNAWIGSNHPTLPQAVIDQANIDGIDNLEIGCWHVADGALLRIGRKKYIATIDENKYYIIKTPTNKISTYQEGLDSLVPREVIGIQHTRQGEWFFVPRGLYGDKELADNLGCSVRILKEQMAQHRIDMGWDYSLPQKGRSSSHVPSYMLLHRGKIYVRGVVKHKQRDHQPRHFGDQWHLAYEGRDVASWDYAGRID